MGKQDTKQDMTNETSLCLEKTLGILRQLRVGIGLNEYHIHDMIAALLTANDIPYKKEYKLATRNRIDFFIDVGIGIEIKKGKPLRSRVIAQLQRYASFEEIQVIILIVERNVNIPDELMGKRCILFGLNRLWGVALS